jgi:hypothetical protein
LRVKDFGAHRAPLQRPKAPFSNRLFTPPLGEVNSPLPHQIDPLQHPALSLASYFKQGPFFGELMITPPVDLSHRQCQENAVILSPFVVILSPSSVILSEAKDPFHLTGGKLREGSLHLNFQASWEAISALALGCINTRP